MSQLHDWLSLRSLTGGHLKPGGLALCQEALKLCHFPAQARLLDVGCGLGSTLGFLSQQNFCCLGVDSNRHLLAEARALVSVPLLQADMLALPLPAASMDGLLYECVLTLAPDMLGALQEAFRVLRTEGTLIVSDLFVRAEGHPPPSAPSGGGAQSTCAQGALSLPRLCDTIRQAGFNIIYQSDHSKALRELAAQWAWQHDSPLCGCSRCSQGKKFGYVLLLARKTLQAPCENTKEEI